VKAQLIVPEKLGREITQDKKGNYDANLRSGIDGRAIMAFRAKNGLEAQDWLDTAQTIRAELMVLQSEGKPLWHGRMKIIARAATLAEKVAYRRKKRRKELCGRGSQPRRGARTSCPRQRNHWDIMTNGWCGPFASFV
jgi:hypothetical protein